MSKTRTNYIYEDDDEYDQEISPDPKETTQELVKQNVH